MRRSLRPRLARLAPTLLLALGLPLAVAAPAAADPLQPPPVDRPLAVLAAAEVTFFYYPASQTLEARMTGEVPPSTRVAGMWLATFTGSRQQTMTSTPTPILQTWTSSAYTIGHSVFFAGIGAVGSLTVDLSYTGAGAYVVAQSIHTIEWNPVLGMNTAGVDPAKPSAP